MLGHSDVAEAIVARPPEMVSVSPSMWDDLGRWSRSPDWRQHFAAAFANGQAFLLAEHALRHRRPLVVEWRGATKAVDDELVPADLRIDHVFLVSCKYLSRILGNAAPGRLFDGLLRLRAPSERTSWYDDVAPDELRALVQAACRHADVGPVRRIADLDDDARERLRLALRGSTWPASCSSAWVALCDVASARTAA